jgi:uncharacterized membrane protein (DUF485 family)
MSVTHSGHGPAVGPEVGRASGYELVQSSREFLTLRRRLGYFVVPVTVMFLGWYFLYVILAAFAPGFMRISVLGEVNVGLCFGLLQFGSTFLIAIGFGRWAPRNFDPLAARLRQRVETGRKP